MNATLTAFITLAATSGVLTLFLCIYAIFRRREIPAARTFIAYTATMAVYIFAYSFEKASGTLEAILRWTVVEYIGIAASPPLGLLMVLYYIGKPPSRSRIIGLFVIPAITFTLVATSGYHELFYKDAYLRADAPVPTVDFAVGYGYIVHGVYTFGCMLAAFVLLVRQWPHTSTYRLQLATLIVGQLLPMTAAFLYLMGVTPHGMDPVPLVLCLTSAAYIWALVSTKQMTVVPIANARILASMQEGVIVLDPAGRLIEYNAAAGRMFSSLSARRIGLPLSEAVPQTDDLVFPDVLPGMHEEFAWRRDGETVWYEVRASAVHAPTGDELGILLMLIDVTEPKRLRDELEQLAYYDGMTRLLNRTAFLERCRAMLAAPEYAASPFSIILYDIDRFKGINDSYGHDAGDRAIIHVVNTLKQMLPADALFGRFGGEEFIIGLPGCSAGDARQLADQLRTSLLDTHIEVQAPGQVEPEMIVITASFGVASGIGLGGSEGAGCPLDALIRRADTAMYMAKRDGRNCVRFAE